MIVRKATNEEREEYLAHASDSLIVAYDHERGVVGYCEYKKVEGVCYIYLIEALVSREGIGTRLVDYLKSQYKRIRAVNVIHDAVGFYQRTGFDCCSDQQTKKYGLDYEWRK